MRGTRPGPRIFRIDIRPVRPKFLPFMDEGTRLNKFLASCGVGSRRACDALVQEGHVEINGQPCLNPATRVAPRDFVKVDGGRVEPKPTGAVIVNKPRGLVCTKRDELERDTIFSLLPPSLRHLNHVGRLDRDSEGLLLLTNDGELTQNLLHPSKNIEKEYLVTANQPVEDAHLDQFLSGLYTEDGKLQAKEIERLSPRRFRVVLITGHKRQIRVMFETLGYRVQRLIRIRIGAFELHDIPPGKWRHLTADDLERLGRTPESKPAPKARRRPAAAKRSVKSPKPKPPGPGRKPAGKKARGPKARPATPPSGKDRKNSPPKARRKRNF